MDTHASFNEKDESIERSESNITLIVDEITFGKGTLYVADSKLYWKNYAHSQVISINYDTMSKFDMCNHPEVHEKPCLQIIVYFNYIPDVDEDDQNEDEEEEKLKSIIKLVPDSPECLNEIYEAITYVQPLHYRYYVDRESNLTDISLRESDENLAANSLSENDEHLADNSLSKSDEHLADNSLSESDENLAVSSLSENDEHLADNSLSESDENLAVNSLSESDENLAVNSLSENDEHLADNSLSESDENLAVNSLSESDENWAVNSLSENDEHLADNSLSESDENLAVNSLSESDEHLADNSLSESDEHLADNSLSESNEHEDSDKNSHITISSTCTLEDQEAGSIDVSNQYHELDAKNGEKENQDEKVLINERKRKFEDLLEQEEKPTKIRKLWNLMKYPFQKITSHNTSISENEPNIFIDEVIAKAIAGKKNSLEPETAVCENNSDSVNAEEKNSQNNSEADGENKDTSINENSQKFCKIM